VREDLDLIRRARAGDAAALDSLFAAHGGEMYRLACAMLGNPEDAEDALQEVFVRIVARLNRFDSGRPFQPWLRRIMVNECLSRLRRRRKDPVVVADCPAAGSVPEPDGNPAEVIREVRRALRLLPPKQRVAIVLVGFEGMGLEGAAEAMGCSVGAVKSHLHRARRKLKTELEGLLPEEERQR